MEGSLIQGIKRLRVLTPCGYDNMDNLALDLSNALDDSSPRLPTNKVKKTKSWKRRSKSTGSLSVLGSSVPKSSAVSDDSESSLDFRIRNPMELSTNGSQPQSDSDDLHKSARFKQQLTSWRHCSVNIGESDSVNENFHPSREQRRKRKFKRMTVDPQPIAEPELKTFSSSSLFPQQQKCKRVRCLKSAKMKKLSQLCDTEVGNVCSGLGEKSSISSGKRKRSVREKSLECSSYEEYHELIAGRSAHSSGNSNCTGHLMELDSICEKWHEVSSSGPSSCESDCGVLTNDEGREADDEQSDFFPEPGPSGSKPPMNEWFEEDLFSADNAKLDAELPEGFFPFTDDAKMLYQYQVGRHIRSGRRRLAQQPTYAAMAEKLYSDVRKTKEDSAYLSKCHEATMGKIFVKDIKRRRRMPPLTGALHGWEVGINFEQEPFKSPAKVFSKEKNQITEGANEENLYLHSEPHQPLFPPPPPPPSPQLFSVPSKDMSPAFYNQVLPNFQSQGDEMSDYHSHLAM